MSPLPRLDQTVGSIRATEARPSGAENRSRTACFNPLSAALAFRVPPYHRRSVAGARCLPRLGLPEWVLTGDAQALATSHAKQRALLVLDIAAGHPAAGRVEAGFALASKAVDAGLEYRSGRIAERAGPTSDSAAHMAGGEVLVGPVDEPEGASR